MPASPPNRKYPFRLGEGSSKLFEKAMASPITPAVTGLSFPSPVDAPTEAAHDRPRPIIMANSPDLSSSAFHPAEFSSDGSVEPPADHQSLDRLWDSLRQEKERKMAKERSKIKSLEETGSETHVQPQFLRPKPTLKKQKSITSYRESSDGRSLVVIFDMYGIAKNDVHVSFQRNRLIVTWDTVEVFEAEEDGQIVRERRERYFHRTLPLPEGTRFEEVSGAMNGQRLVLRYPNSRSFRVERVGESGSSGERGPNF